MERMMGIGSSYHMGSRHLAGTVVFLLGGILTISVVWLSLPNLETLAVLLRVLLPGTVIGSVLMGVGGLWMRKSRTKTLVEIPTDLVPAVRELIAKHRKAS